MLTASEIYKRYEALRNIKSHKRTVMEQVDDYFAPSDAILTGKSKVGSGDLKGELLETTGTDLIDEYVSFVLGLQFNSETRWFTIKDTKTDPVSDINKVLAARSDVLHYCLSSTNYYSVLSSLERDVIVHGHGALRAASSETSFIKCYTAEPEDIIALQNSFNEVYMIFWPERLKGFELRDRFNIIKADTKWNTYTSNHYTQEFILLAVYMPAKAEYYDHKITAEKIPEGSKTMVRYIAFPADTAVLKNEGLDMNMMDLDEVEFFKEEVAWLTRDMYVRGSAYGSGIGKKALPKSRIVNKLMYNLLRLAGLQSNPPRTQHSLISAESGNVGEIKEGQVFTLSHHDLDGLDPSKAINLLQVTGDLSALLQLYQLQQAQLAALLPTAGSVYKVARQSISEINQRLSEQEKRLAPLRKTFLLEGPQKHLKYFYAEAERQGKFNREDLTLSRKVNIDDLTFDVDVAQISSFKQGKALRAAQALGLVANFLSLQPSGVDNFNIDRIIDIAFDGYNVLDLLESRENVRRKREIQRQQIEQQQQLAQQQAALASDASNAKVMQAIAQLNQSG